MGNEANQEVMMEFPPPVSITLGRIIPATKLTSEENARLYNYWKEVVDDLSRDEMAEYIWLLIRYYVTEIGEEKNEPVS